MQTLTREQLEALRGRGLSDDRIKQLAAEKGFTLPSAGVDQGELRSIFGKAGEMAGRAVGKLVSPFAGGAAATLGEKAGEAVGGAVGGVARFTGVEKLGQGIGFSLFQLTPEYRELEAALDRGDISPEDFKELATGNITPGEVIGSGVRTAATIASAGTIGAGGVAPTAPTILRGVGQGALRGAKAGAGSGAIFGAAEGVAEGLEEGQDPAGIAAEALAEGTKAAAVGGVAGGVLGTAAGGIQTALRNVQERKDEALKILSASVDDAPGALGPSASRSAAPYKIDPVLQTAVKDESFKQAIKDTALLPDDLALVKASRTGDHAAYQDMIRLAQSDDVMAVEPVNSRAGETFLKRLRDISSAQADAGKEIDVIARTKLAGQKVDALAERVDAFSDELNGRGISVMDDGTLDFAGSDFEDLPGIQRILQTVYRRVSKLDNDALKAHQLKRFLDTQLDYGKTTEGVTGSAERLLKGLRAGIDGAIDTSDEAYNLANTRYAAAANARSVVQRLLGKDFNIDNDLATARAGEVMQRVLGSAPSRTLQALSDVEKTAGELGFTYDDSVIAQIRFADMLEDITGAPTRSLGGQVDRAARRIFQIPQLVRQMLPFTDDADALIQEALTKSPEQRLQALSDYVSSLAR